MNLKIKTVVISSLFLIAMGIGLLTIGTYSSDALPAKNLPVPLPNTETTIATNSAALGIEEQGIMVTEVVDGDTIKLETGETVRMVGIDTPETVDPRRPVGCFGKEASNETKALLTNKRVILQKDITDKDKYGRILRLVYLSLDDGSMLFINDYLVREGFAKNYKYPPDIKFEERFKKAEDEARRNKKGMWGKCDKLKL